MKIQGQVCHKTPNSLLCDKNKKPSCGQLYIYDDLTSIKKRLETNENLIRDHIEIITDVMSHNPIAKITSIYINYLISKIFQISKCILSEKMTNNVILTINL